MRGRSVHLTTLLLLAGWTYGCLGADPPLYFRREWMPESLLRRQQDLIPVKRVEFDKWIEAVSAESSNGPPRLTLESLEIDGGISPSGATGRAALQISSTTTTGGFLSLGGLRMSITNAVWEGPKSTPASLGTTADGQLGVIVPVSGKLTFDWSAAVAVDPFGGLRLDIGLPESSQSSMTLRAPAGWTCQAGEGLRVESFRGNAWHVVTTGARNARLQFQSPSASPGPLVLCQEDVRWSIAPGVAETTCAFRIDVFREPLSHLRLRLPPRWETSSVRLGESELAFDTERDGEQHSLKLDFDPPMSGVNRRLTIKGRTLLDSERFELPRVEMSDAVWLSGEATIEGAGVELDRWEPNDNRWLRSTPNGSTTQSMWRLERGGAPTCRWQVASHRLSVASATAVRFDDDSITAKVFARFNSQTVGAYSVEAVVSPQWVVDSVDAADGAAVQDWNIQPDGDFQRLTVSFSKAVGDPAQRGGLVVEARRPTAAGNAPLRGSDLLPLDWQALRQPSLVALQFDTTREIELQGTDRLNPVNPETPEVVALLRQVDDVPSAIYSDDAAFRVSRLVFADEASRFSAAWQIDLAVEGSGIREQADVQLTPTAAPLDRIRVAISPAGQRKIQWLLPEAEREPLEARLVRAADDSQREDEWEITLPRPKRSAFTLRAVASGDDAQFRTLFFRCLAAQSETGVVQLPRKRLQAHDSAELHAVWSDADSGLSRWSFIPSSVTRLTVSRAHDGDSICEGFAAKADLETHWGVDQLRHSVTYEVFGAPGQLFTIALSGEATAERLTINGRERNVAWSAADHAWKFELPESGTRHVVRVEFATATPWNQALTRIRPFWPQLKVPVLKRQWRLTLPEPLRLLAEPQNRETALWDLRNEERAAMAASALTPTHVAEFHETATLDYGCLIVHDSAARGFGWAIALCIAAGIGAMRGFGGWRLLGCVLLFGACCFLLPAGLAVVSRLGLLGLWLGLALRWLTQFRSLERSHRSQTARVATAFGILLPVLGFDATGLAQTAAEKIHRVVTPVDAAGKPVGEYVYTTERFFKELFRRAQQTAASPNALITTARYQASPGDGHSWESLAANISIEVLRPGPVVVPWPRTNGEIASRSILLNGQPTSLTFDAEGRQFSVLMDSLGKHQLEFLLRPREAEKDWQLAIPLVSDTSITLPASNDSEAFSVYSPGARRVNRQSGVEQFQLVASSLQLSRRRNEPDAPLPVAEQLVWIRVFHGAAVIEGRWKFRRVDEELDRVQVDVDPSFELISTAASTPAVTSWQSEAGKSKLVWQLSRPAQEVIVEAQLVRRDTAGLPLPGLHPQAEVTRRWTALDGGESLLERLPAVNLEPIDAAEFATTWGAEEPPLRAWQSDASDVLLETRKLNEPLKYRGNLTCRVGRRDCEFDFIATILQPRGGGARPVKIACSPDVQIESVELHHAGQREIASWMRLASGDLLVAGTLQEGHEVHLLGRRLHGEKTALRLPEIADAVVRDYQVSCLRTLDVACEATLNGNTSTDAAGPTERAVDSSLALVDQWQADAARPPSEQLLEYTVAENRPRTVGFVITTLEPGNQRSKVRFDAFLAVRDGVVDALRFEIPSSLTPRLLSPDATLDTFVAASGSKVLRCVPSNARAGRFHIAFECDLVARREVPHVQLLESENVQQFVRLPRTSQQSWMTSGLQDASLPASLQLPPEPDHATYRVTTPHFTAAAMSEQPTKESAQVAWYSKRAVACEGGVLVECRFVVLPADQSQLRVEVPEGARLLQVLVEGQPAAMSDAHSIPLRSATLPQMIFVRYLLFQNATGDAANGLNFPETIVVDAGESASAESDSVPPLASLVSFLSPYAETAEAGWASAWRQRLLLALWHDTSHDASTRAEAERLVEMLKQTGEQPPSVEERENLLSGIERPPTERAFNVSWLLGLATWCAVVLLAGQVATQPIAMELARRWAAGLFALTALVVAALVSPLFGGALLVAAAWMAIRWPWRAKRA